MNGTPPHCPLGEQHCAALDNVIAKTPNALKLCDDCERVGIPVDEFKQQLQQQLDVARKMKSQWFPHKV